MKKFWIAFIVIAVLVSASMVVLWRVMATLDTEPDIEGGMLVWHVAEAYQEERNDELISRMVQGSPPLMREIVFALKRAAKDEDIDGLLLNIQALPVDWAKVEELQQAVQDFAATGKPVVAYLENAGVKEYALAVTAPEVVLAPEAYLMVLGISAELSFIKNTLDKLGMQADFVHVGKFKSAPESMTREKSSPAAREMIESIVDERYENLLADIAQGRGMSEEDVSTWIDAGMFDAGTALSAGLVDSVMCFEDLKERLVGEDASTDFQDYLLLGGRGNVAGKVAVIYATGTIMPGESRQDNFQGKVAGSQTVIEQLHDAGEAEDIDAVVLRVDSPGGSALASDLIWNEVGRVRQIKPIIVSMSGYAASGGYYISCGADSIFAQPGTLTGSIGVFAGKVDMSGLYDKIGVQREFITRGENALLFGNNAVFSSAQRQQLQDMLEDFYSRFLDKVATGRGFDSTKVAAVAQGRVWTGQQALAQDLVDGMGGLDRAITSAKWMLDLSREDKVAVVSYERQLSFVERLLLRSLQDISMTALPTWPPYSLAAELARDGTLEVVPLLDGRPVALLPYRVLFR